MHDWYHGHQSKLYSWIKGRTADPAPPGITQQAQAKAGNSVDMATLTGDPVETQARLEKEWRKVWQAPKVRGDNWESTTDCLSSLPAFPQRSSWTRAEVERTLSAMARNKAPGLDEWRVFEMRVWPDWLHTCLAQLVNQVEIEGH